MKKNYPPRQIGKEQRKSNIELLRVVAMLMILVLHTRFDGIEAVYECAFDAGHFMIFLFEAIAIVGVNLFILISGYFGIHPNRKNVLKLLFQIYFFGLVGLVGWIVVQGTWMVEVRHYVKALLPVSQTIWFIPNYIILMLFSPVLNAFCEKYNAKQIAIFTMAVYTLSYFWTAIVQGTISGFGGYSWGWFMQLYLTGRVIRFHTDIHTYKKRYFLMGYIILTFVIVSIAFVQHEIPIGKSLLWNYDCPLVYLSSISLFLCFVKMDLGYRKWINWLAASSFAVLLFHVSPFAHYKQVNQLLYNTYSGISCIVITGIIIVAYYLAGLLLDQIRILIFSKITK